MINQRDKRISNEIAHAEYLIKNGAGEVWNWETPAGQIRWKRRVKMLMHNIKKEHSVLELGCGTGYFSKEIVKSGAQIFSIDISSKLIDICKKSITEPNILFEVENAYDLKYENNFFDFIIGSSVLHHLDINKSIKEIYRTLKPGGSLILTEPNMLNPQIAIQKNIPFIKKYLGDSPDETAFFRWKLKKDLTNTGFSNIKIIPFDFLHPKTPKLFIKSINNLGYLLERAYFIKEFAGSLYIIAKK